MPPVFDPLRLSAVSMDVLSAGRALPEALATRQKVRLQALLQGVLCDSPFYQQHLRGVDSSMPLSALRPVTRSTLMAHFDDWVTDPRLKLAGLRTFTADPARISEPYLGRYIVWESSGTSGEPGIFVQDAQAMAVYDALEALRRTTPRPLMRWMDPLYLSERIAFVGALGGHFASHVSIQRLRQLNPWMAQVVRSFSIMQPVDALLAAIQAFSPSVIATYPTVAALLADEAGRGHLRIRPREIWTGGETLRPAVRQRVEQQLGCTVRNSYGASEFLTLGWECSHGQMHLNADWAILEPVDEQGRPVPPGEMSCATLLTHLGNRVQPLIRYELGDQITFQPQRCSCGSSMPVIQVEGRRDDPLVMTGLKGQPVTLLPLALTTVLEDEAGVFDFQLRQQDGSTLVLRLGLSGDEAAAAMARCRTVLQAFAAAQGLPPLRLLEEPGQPVPRGRSGKACRVMARPD
jgi:phenylacetate-coenzyme A ligase PaaK-like adenylate-forming protein